MSMPRKHKEFLKANRHLYGEILRAQGGKCALCPRQPTPRRRLDLDHDHHLMEIRGVLCHRCNRALPAWMTPEWLRKAAIYLEGALTDWQKIRKLTSRS